jgi:4-amino-4-deoxy-L-arabinose transferase-like glycosyltransferase
MPIMRFKHGSLVILLILCGLLFFFGLGSHALWDIDEGMHAATSKDMVLSGDWVTPQLNGEKFYDKPIFFNWLAAISFVIFGFTEFAARLPAALLGTACTLATYFFGKRVWGNGVGLLSGVILATSVEFMILSRTVVHDMALAVFVTLTLFFFFVGVEEQERRRTCFLLAYASAGFAVLAKGPLGVVLPALVIFPFLILKRRSHFLRGLEIGWGVVIFLAIAAPWYVLVASRNPGYAGYFFIKQNLMNFASGEPTHPRPFYYYVPILVGGFFPWSLFFPLALVHEFRGRASKGKDRVLFLLLWIGLIFLFFSVASSKLSTYILPIFPAASLVVALLWHDFLETPSREMRRRFLLSYSPFVILSCLGLLYLFIFRPPLMDPEAGVPLDQMKGFMVFASGSGLLGLFFLLRRHDKAFFSTLAGVVVCSVIIVSLFILPTVDPYRSTKVLVQKLDRLLPPGKEMVFFYRLRDSGLFYTHRRAILYKSYDQLIRHLASDKPAYCIISRKRYEMRADLAGMSYILAEEGGKLLISNRPS